MHVVGMVVEEVGDKAMTDSSSSSSKEDQINQIKAIGEKLAELKDIRDNAEFIRRGAILARDIFNIGFVNGKNAGYNEGYDAAVQTMKERLGRRLQELK